MDGNRLRIVGLITLQNQYDLKRTRHLHPFQFSDLYSGFTEMSAIERLQMQSDRQKVTAWLEYIGAPKDEADEVLELCVKDKEARAYYVMRYEGDCKCKQPINN